MADTIKQNEFTVATDLTGALVTGINSSGQPRNFPLASIVRPEGNYITAASSPPSGARYAGETYYVEPTSYGTALPNFGGLTIPVEDAGKIVFNGKVVYNNGAWQAKWSSAVKPVAPGITTVANPYTSRTYALNELATQVFDGVVYLFRSLVDNNATAPYFGNSKWEVFGFNDSLAFSKTISLLTIYDGNTDDGIAFFINQASPYLWKAGNRCVIIDVTGREGHTISVAGRDGMTGLKDNVWLTSSSHVVDAVPAYLNGTWGTSRFTGDIDVVVPTGATHLYVYREGISRKIVVKDVTASSVNYSLKEGALPPTTASAITTLQNSLSDKVAKTDIDTNNSGGSGKVASADAFKKVNDRFDITSETVYSGTLGLITTYINQGTVKQWQVSSTYRALILPITGRTGHTLRLSGRDGQTLLKDNVWLTSDAHVVNTDPSYLNGTWGTSRFTGDIDVVVPLGATHLYCFLESTAVSILIQDLTVTNTVLKEGALPPTTAANLLSIQTSVTAFNAALPTLGLKNTAKLIVTKYTDVVIGRDCNLYAYDAMHTAPDQVHDYTIVLKAQDTITAPDSKIRYRDRAVKYKPTAAASDMILDFVLRDNNFNALDTKRTTFRTIPQTGGSGTKNVCWVGDSYFEMAYIIKEAMRLCALDSDFVINNIGTRNGNLSATSTTKTEGRSGWKWSNYINDAVVGTRTNAFMYSGALNFAQYCTDNGFTGIDVMIINLGINDAGNGLGVVSDTGLLTICNQAKTFMTALWANFPTCKVILNTPAVGGLRSPYGAIQGFRQYNIAKLSLKYVELFDNSAYDARCFLVNTAAWLDRVNGFTRTIVDSADRYPGVTELEETDFVHANEKGMYQIADADYSKLRSVLLGL